MRKENSPAMQRATALLQLPALLAPYGVSMDDVLEGTSILPGDIKIDSYVPFAGYLEMLDRAALLSGCDHIGLKLGACIGLDTLGPIGQAMRHAATLGEALSDFVNLQIGNSTGGAAYLHRAGSDFIFGYCVYDARSPVSRHHYDLALAAGCKIVRELAGGSVTPIEILSIPPAPADVGPYQKIAGCPVRFNQHQTCIVLPGAAMSLRPRNADPAMREAVIASLHMRHRHMPWGTSERVRHAMRPMMLTGRVDRPAVAAHLKLHVRTLCRRLAREGTTFEDIKDEVRYRVARELLLLTRLPVSDVGMSLDFATPSAFTRAFRRWSGHAPMDWRQNCDTGQFALA